MTVYSYGTGLQRRSSACHQYPPCRSKNAVVDETGPDSGAMSQGLQPVHFSIQPEPFSVTLNTQHIPRSVRLLYFEYAHILTHMKTAYVELKSGRASALAISGTATSGFPLRQSHICSRKQGLTNQLTTQFWWGVQMGMARGAVWSRSLS